MPGEAGLVEILDDLRALGFAGDMFVTPDALVHCSACDHDTAPADLELHDLRRVEGASDPADMAAVLALTCKVCGMQGTAVVRFGPEAEPQDVIVLRAVDDERFQPDE